MEDRVGEILDTVTFEGKVKARRELVKWIQGHKALSLRANHTLDKLCDEILPDWREKRWA